MSTTAITFLFSLLWLELLFTAGCACVLFLRRSDEPPAGRRMRPIWIAVWLCSLIPLRIFTPTTSVTIYEEPVTQAVRIEFTEYAPDGDREMFGESEASQEPSDSFSVLPTDAEPLIIRLRASSAEWIQAIL